MKTIDLLRQSLKGLPIPFKYLRIPLLTLAVLPIAFAEPSTSVQNISFGERNSDSPGGAMSSTVNNLKELLTGKKTRRMERSLPLGLTAGDSDSWIVEPAVGKQRVNLIMGNSHVLRFNRVLQRLSISNPEIADVAIIDKSDVLINAKQKGAGNLIVWDANSQVFVYNITVSSDPRPLKEALTNILPESKDSIEVLPTETGFVVKGSVDTVEKQNQISSTAQAFSDKSVSVVTVDEAKQILLEIRFVEVDRTRGIDFGIDWDLQKADGSRYFFLPGATDAMAVIDEDSNSLARGFPDDQTNSLFTSRINKKSNSFGTTLKALEDKNLLKIIARPNLLVRDGEKASFLVGGEFPVPVVTQNTVNITYKEFGTRLSYQPQILKDDLIRLTLESEVSQLDSANAVTINNFRIPALASRKATSVVELESGHTLVIGGLIQHRLTNDESGTPFLRRVPLIGKLFESTDKTFTDVELLIIITPRIIDSKTETVELDKLSTSHPLKIASALDNPPFENERAAAIEETLSHGVLPKKINKETSDDRDIKRKQLLLEYAMEKKLEREERMKQDEEFYKVIDEVLYEGKKPSGPAPK